MNMCRMNLGLSQFFQLSFNVRLARVMPLICLRTYMYALGALYYSARARESIKMIACLEFVLNSCAVSANFYWSAVKTFCGIFEHYLEKLLMAHRPFTSMMEFLRRKVRIKNREYLDRIVQAGTGGLIVTGHYGAVEYLPLAMAMNGYKVAMIVRFKTEALRRELMKRAAMTDVILIDADEPKVAFRALEVIKSGRFLITECDEFSEWRPHKNQKVSVFGNWVNRDKTLDFFYRRTKVPAVLCLMKREDDGFVLSVDHLADGDEQVSVAEKAWNCLEKHILEAPEQWYQWKDAASVLEGFMESEKKGKNADKKLPHIPAADTVLSAG